MGRSLPAVRCHNAGHVVTKCSRSVSTLPFILGKIKGVRGYTKASRIDALCPPFLRRRLTANDAQRLLFPDYKRLFAVPLSDTPRYTNRPARSCSTWPLSVRPTLPRYLYMSIILNGSAAKKG